MAIENIKWHDVVNVVGLTQMDQGWKQLEPGDRVIIRRDPTNKYDCNATGVFLINGKQVGWIPKAKNKDFARIIDESVNKDFSAFVTSTEFKEGKTITDFSDILYIRINPAMISGPKTVTVNISTPQTKEKTMSTLDTVINTNQDMAMSAAFLEAGRIANGQATKLASKHLPLMARGYADTPAGRLLLANAASFAAAKFRPGNKRLTKLTNAMMVSAYQELIQTFDIEKMIDEMLDNATIKSALDKVDGKTDTKE